MLLNRPPFIGADILLIDHCHRDQHRLFRRGFALQDVVADLHRFRRHDLRILRRGGDKQRVLALERLFAIRRAVDANDKELVTLCLFRRQIGADRRRIVNGENAVDLRIGGQQRGHHLQPPFAAAFSVLVRGQHLNLRVALEFGLAALDTVLHGGDRRSVDDHHIAFALQTVGNIFTGQLACLGIIGGNGRVCAFCRHVHRHHYNARLFGAFNRRANALRVSGVENDHVHFGGDKVIDLRHLLAQIVTAGDQRHLDVISRQLARFQLGTYTALRGAAYLLADGTTVINSNINFEWIGNNYLGPIPWLVVIALAVIVVCWFILRRTTLGVHIYAVGGNMQAARLTGIKVWLVLLFVYGMSGLLSGLGGVMSASRLYSANGNLGTGYELDAIAAVILGGTSFVGGIGTITGTLVGALIIATLNNGMTLMGVSYFWQLVIKGAVIIIAVLIDKYRTRHHQSA